MTEQGICPICGNDDLNYEGLEPEGEMVRFEVDCQECGWLGYEWYSLTFIESTIR